MRRLLLAAAGSFTALTIALTIAATPAAALDRPGSVLIGASGSFGVTVHRGSDFTGDFRNNRRHRGTDGLLYVGDREYQGDTAWRPDGFNDWWHDRPSRSEPRWLRSNNCERQYWTGGGWRC